MQLPLIALLGRKDEPTDAIEEYWLSRHCPAGARCAARDPPSSLGDCRPEGCTLWPEASNEALERDLGSGPIHCPLLVRTGIPAQSSPRSEDSEICRCSRGHQSPWVFSFSPVRIGDRTVRNLYSIKPIPADSELNKPERAISRTIPTLRSAVRSILTGHSKPTNGVTRIAWSVCKARHL